MQKDKLIVMNPEQAKALQNVGFLSQFIQAASPSDVAKKLGMPANLVHHHTKRYLELGLLKESKRKSGKIFYQLIATSFAYSRNLIPLQSADHPINVDLSRLTERFFKAYERSEYLAGNDDPDFYNVGFETAQEHPETPQFEPEQKQVLEAHPAHFQMRTLRLKKEDYLLLVQQIADLLETAARSKNSSEQDLCSFAFLAFEGEISSGAQDSSHFSSYAYGQN